ncbi:UNVERIFIED_CONTAM: hypothetical protein PYX00_001087 [Menopon gallinae]|uniref:Uncharacterized protein n=1 Tax=Menopon gallinae TaxID=328185 RepID=A0AAW2IBF2_9NEOP
MQQRNGPIEIQGVSYGSRDGKEDISAMLEAYSLQAPACPLVSLFWFLEAGIRRILMDVWVHQWYPDWLADRGIYLPEVRVLVDLYRGQYRGRKEDWIERPGAEIENLDRRREECRSSGIHHRKSLADRVEAVPEDCFGKALNPAA